MATTLLRPQALYHNILQRKDIKLKILKEMEGGDIALKISRFSAEYLPRALIRKPIYNLYNYII